MPLQERDPKAFENYNRVISAVSETFLTTCGTSAWETKPTLMPRRHTLNLRWQNGAERMVVANNNWPAAKREKEKGLAPYNEAEILNTPQQLHLHLKMLGMFITRDLWKPLGIEQKFAAMVGKEPKIRAICLQGLRDAGWGEHAAQIHLDRFEHDVLAHVLTTYRHLPAAASALEKNAALR